MTVTLERFTQAAKAFRAFFDELGAHYLERSQVITQLELALLSREHALVFGPPGTAKSELVLSVVRRIVDEKTGEASIFSKQIAETTVQADIIGPVDYKTLTETGRTEHLTDEGMLGAIHGVLDEVFDGREMMLRSILNVLQEREVKSGRQTKRGRIEVAIMTSNRYLSEVVARNPELMLAFADRVSYVSFVPKGFASRASRAAMLKRAARDLRPDFKARLTLQDVDALQAATEAVRVPDEVLEGLERLAEQLERDLAKRAREDKTYQPTKYFSNRTLVRSLQALKAAVVQRASGSPRPWPLRATLDDLAMLQYFFTLAGPSLQDLEALRQAATDPREKVQLAIARTEAAAFAECYARVAQAMAGGAGREAKALNLAELDAESRRLARLLLQAHGGELEGRALEVAAFGRALLAQLAAPARHAANQAAIGAAVRALGEVVLRKLQILDSPQGIGALLEATEEVAGACLRVVGLERLAAALVEAGTAAAEAMPLRLLEAERAAELAEAEPEPVADLAERIARVARELDLVDAAIVELAASLPVPREAIGAVEKAGRAARAGIAETTSRLGARALAAEGAPPPGMAALAADYVRLAPLDTAVKSLEPAARSPRSAILAARIAQVLEDSLPPPGTNAVVLEIALRASCEALGAAGVDPSNFLPAFESALSRRVQAVLVDAARGREGLAVPAELGSAGASYRRRFPIPEGNWRAIRAIQAMLGGEHGGTVALVGEEDDARLATADLAEIERRVEYLDEWQSRVDVVVRKDLSGASTAERALEVQRVLTGYGLTKILFEQREAERLMAELRALQAQPAVADRVPARVERLKAVRDRLNVLAEDVLAARAGISVFLRSGTVRMPM